MARTRFLFALLLIAAVFLVRETNTQDRNEVPDPILTCPPGYVLSDKGGLCMKEEVTMPELCSWKAAAPHDPDEHV
ncbi:Hypothetical predicted protein [Cloeon dipterum]|uniref:Uncharacterized protein n=1 Tax=Cloeon dipterum TaxID=197152 RepID=A0A8S1CR19_9INSE|nr:Hypothetical predicted protein [Cloeon dipterum]